MTKFADLKIQEQAALVLISLIDDLAAGKRTLAAIEHPMDQLYDILATHYNVPQQEVDIVADAVAKRGTEMLPGYDNGTYS